MDLFVKTRRNRSGSSTQVQGFHQKESVASNHEHNKPLTSSSTVPPVRFVEDVGYDAGVSSSEERSSWCSSPLSEYSYSSIDSDLEEVIAEYRRPTSSLNERTDLKRTNMATKRATAPSNVSPLLSVDTDAVVEILSFLSPSETLGMLTMPLCREWHYNYGINQDLWKALCRSEPFQADLGQADSADDHSSDDSFTSLPVEPAVKTVFGEHRLMYTSFVRCLRYLDRIKEDSRKGRTPAVFNYGHSGFPRFGTSKGLKKFLKTKTGILGDCKVGTSYAAAISTSPGGVCDVNYRKRAPAIEETVSCKKPKYGHSMITSRLLGPSSKGDPSHLQLPKSCAIYSIVNWMVAYPEVIGIQIKCVATLPILLEDESQRLLATNVGLVEPVLTAMIRFPECLKLHIAAFQSLVLLARPLGGREGMLFDNAMTDSTTSSAASPLLETVPSGRNQRPSSLDQGKGSNLNGANGIGVMLDSMRRFENDSELQAMACWAFVNLALVPAQKTMILALGGFEVILHTMRRHSDVYDVQFRALFALINLVVISKTPKPLSFTEGLKGPQTEKDVLDASVEEAASLVVQSMVTFCSSGAIVNRACLVLHNLAQSRDYLGTLLRTPHCYQLLEWCVANYPTDLVLRRSALSTLHRLQTLLANNHTLRAHFAGSLRTQGELPVVEAAVPSAATQHVHT